LAQGFSEGWFGVSLDARDHLYRCFGEADGGVALTAATLAPSAVIESTDFDARITQLPVYFNARDAGVVHAKLGPDALRSTAMAGFTRVQVTYVCPPPCRAHVRVPESVSCVCQMTYVAVVWGSDHNTTVIPRLRFRRLVAAVRAVTATGGRGDSTLGLEDLERTVCEALCCTKRAVPRRCWLSC
jgi:hypothetical protein